MSDLRDKPCPHCGRPMGFEYVAVERGKCQLWRWVHESMGSPDDRTISDCFRLTSKRIEELNAKAATLEAEVANLRRVINRKHGEQRVKAEPFRDGARIEVG